MAFPAQGHPLLTTADGAELDRLAAALATVGRRVRDAVGAGPRAGDEVVVDRRGGDDVFGVDERAEGALLDAMQSDIGPTWPGTLVLEGFDDPVTVGAPGGPWRFLVDPVDGSRPWLAEKRSAWVLLGAGRAATTLDELQISACVELPTARAALGLVASAVRDSGPPQVQDDLLDGSGCRQGVLVPSTRTQLSRSFVTVARFGPGGKAAVGAWEDEVLAGLETYEDPYLSSGGQLIEVAAGREMAVLDPRPFVGGSALAAHPYDLAGWLVARQAGVVVEALPFGPLDYPLDTTTPCAWAAYANEAIASELRLRLRRATPAHDAPGSR